MKDLKEKLKGTCVLNEKEGMGAEIVKLYTEAGFVTAMKGSVINFYYGISSKGYPVSNNDSSIFTSVLTLDQLRSIVRGEREELIEPSTGCNEDFKKSNPLAESVEFKEGEMVEGIFEGEGSHGEFLFTGGITQKERHFICEDKFGALRFFTEIRKIDPDKEYRDLAEDMTRKSAHYSVNNNRYILKEDVENMLIEAMKRVKK